MENQIDVASVLIALARIGCRRIKAHAIPYLVLIAREKGISEMVRTVDDDPGLTFCPNSDLLFIIGAEK